MKNSIKNIAVAFAFVTSFAFAANAENKETKKASAFGTGVYINKGGKINVLVDKADNNAATTILVKNEQGEVVYREVVGKGNQKFGRQLNVTDLEAGKYDIDVISKNETQTKSFQLSDQKTERVLTIK
ncbi:DUF3244 domain-containing protein [Dyadobacter sp. CY356]|uniref:DUF3244 domain-containing protein n=1 Tax=Dyadobacter sp. CY356 TaxID=2906442 RepID=UPI001F15FA7D|nr:hypothetical protein [Dyadobacter sp. CY356]MCF0058103.1 hypothetical protein [Dyadobacter sp. CY356]